MILTERSEKPIHHENQFHRRSLSRTSKRADRVGRIEKSNDSARVELSNSKSITRRVWLGFNYSGLDNRRNSNTVRLSENRTEPFDAQRHGESDDDGDDGRFEGLSTVRWKDNEGSITTLVILYYSVCFWFLLFIFSVSSLFDFLFLNVIMSMGRGRLVSLGLSWE